MKTQDDTRQQDLLRTLPLALIALGAITGAIAFRDALGFDALAAHRATLEALRDSHYVASMALFVAAYAAMVAFSLPGATVATLAGGFLFGLFPGVVLNVLGATLGATALFVAARAGLGARLAARLDQSDGRIGALKAGIDENQWSVLFVMRLVPVVPFFVANLVPAMVGVPLGRFVISTALGIVPGALIYTSIGAGMGEVLDRGEVPDLGVIFEPQILLPMLGLGALAAAPMLVKAWRRRGPPA